MSKQVLRFQGHKYFRQRLALSLLSQIPIRIDGIRSNEEDPGVKPFEVSLLRLIERMTQGTSVEISYTGTSLVFVPGTLSGGVITHQCHPSKPIGWYLEYIVVLAPFGKKPLTLTADGITNGSGDDVSVDMIRHSALPLLVYCLADDSNHSFSEMELKITRRGFAPLGGGQVVLSSGTAAQVRAGLMLDDPGRIKKIRGLAFSSRVNPQMVSRIAYAAKGIMNRYIPDIYIFTDAFKGEEAGKSPGYALNLVATSSTGVVYSSEATSSDKLNSPEDVGSNAVQQLLTEIAQQSCVDRGFEWMACLLLGLSPEEAARVRLSELSPRLVQFLRDFNAFFGATFKIKESEDHFTLSCVGLGYTNMVKKRS